MSKRFPNHIRQLNLRPSTSLESLPDVYKFAPKGRMQWIQKWLWAALVWFDCIEEHVETVEVTTYTNVQSKRLLDAILYALEDANRDVREPQEIIIGAEDWTKLVGEMNKVDGPFQYMAGPFGHGAARELYGVKVRVLPWIKGWAVI